MPLYQMILLSKVLNPQQSATLMSKISKSIWKQGGAIRDIKILSDRILAKQAKAIDGYRTIVARYNQVLFDGSPMLMDVVRKQLKLEKNVLKIDFFKIKDFYNYAQQYTKQGIQNDKYGANDTMINTQNKKMDTARRIAIMKQEGGM